jgi:esterase/lipase
MTTNPEAIQMLNADTYWCRKQTASFLFQIFRMRLATLKKAKLITKPGLVMQTEADKSVVNEASYNLYGTLTSKDKTWKTFPGYAHDSELEADRSLLDNEVVTWIREYVVQIPGGKVTQ